MSNNRASAIIFNGANKPLTEKKFLINLSLSFFWLAAILIGAFSGPNQAASRSLMGRFTPEAKKNEFFGFFAFSGKATAFAGPLLLGMLTVAFDSQRVGISVVFLFFVFGFLLMNRVDEEKGMQQGELPGNDA